MVLVGELEGRPHTRSGHDTKARIECSRVLYYLLTRGAEVEEDDKGNGPGAQSQYMAVG